MIVSNIASVTKAIDKKIDKVDTNVMAARDEMMARLIQLAQEEIKGKRGQHKSQQLSQKSAKASYLMGDFYSPESFRNYFGSRAAFSKSGGQIYDKAIPGKPPMNRTGNLRRSIKGEKMRVGFASYAAVVGPTIIYGRRVELGGGNWPVGTKFPYMKPAWERFRPLAQGIIRKHLAL